MNCKLKIAIYAEGFHTGGTERQLAELIKGIDRERFEVYALASRYGGQMAQDLANAGIALEYFPLTSLRQYNALRQLTRLRRFLAVNRIDVLHTYSLTGNTFGVLAGLLARVPVIITSRRDMGVMIPPLYWPLQIAFSWCADAVTTNAEAIKRMLVEKEHVRADKTQVIYNGIDLALFSASTNEREAVRAELGIEADAPVIGMVAQIKPVKGHVYLLEAVRQIKSVLPNLRLLLIGSGSFNDLNILKEDIARLGIEDNILLLGQRSDIPRLLSAIDVSVLSSLSEGVSNSLLESMAAGTPVVATNVGGNPEIVRDGKTGLIVPPADPAAIAMAIMRLLGDRELSARLAAAAREMVFSEFGNARMVENFEQLYIELTTAKQRRAGLAARAGLRRRIASA